MAAVVVIQPCAGWGAESITDLFKDFVFAGCFNAFESGIPIAAYAQGLNLPPANPQLAAAFLRGRAGNAYMKATPATVLIIAETGDACTVATRTAPDLSALTQAIETALAGLSAPFTFTQEEQRPLVGGGTAKTRLYDGTINQRPFGILLSTIAEGVPQATLTLYRK